MLFLEEALKSLEFLTLKDVETNISRNKHTEKNENLPNNLSSYTVGAENKPAMAQQPLWFNQPEKDIVKMGTVAVISHGKHHKAVWLNASNTAFHCMVQLVCTKGQDCLTLVSRIKIKRSLCQVLNQRKCVIIQGCVLSQILTFSLNTSCSDCCTAAMWEFCMFIWKS